MTDDVIIEIKWAALLAEFIFSYNICYSTVVHVKKNTLHKCWHILFFGSHFLTVGNLAFIPAQLTKTASGLPTFSLLCG